MPKVREMMTGDPESVDADATVREAAEKMRQIDVGAVPVIGNGRVLGIVTDRDITVRVIAANRRPGEVRVREIASADVVTTTPDAEMAEATALMAQHQIRRLPVVEDGRLVGMLSLGDLSVDGSTRDAGRALREISTPAEPER